MQPPLFDYLKASTGDLWQRAQEHHFVSALADASLERDSFIYYLKQDYAYLIGYSRAIALATARAPTLDRMAEFAALLSETLSSEMQLHRDFCAQFEITPEELATVEPAPICRAYIDFCIATAATGDMLELLSALIPCGVGYAEIGARLLEHPTLSPSHPYRQWIYTYGGEDYQQYAQWMVTALNELGAELPESRLPRLTPLFRLGLRYEWLFWEMAWRRDDWPL
jgi:thiaminase/transcriptional activator TenA